MSDVTIKRIKKLRFSGICILIVTVILWLGLWGASAVPSGKSHSFTDSVTNVINSVFSLSEKIEGQYKTQTISISADASSTRFYCGDSFHLNVKCFPADSLDRDVTFSIDKPDLSEIDENGFVKCIKKGTTTVVATLKSDPSVTAKYSFTCYGEDIKASPERFDLELQKTSSEDKYGSLAVGYKRKLVLNNNATYYSVAEYFVEDETIAYCHDGYVYGRKAGDTKIIATLKDDSSAVKEFPLHVEHSDKVLIDSLSVSGQPEFVHKSVTSRLYSFIDIPEGADEVLYECIIVADDKKIIRMTRDSASCVGYGNTTLTFVSVFNPEVKSNLDVTVKKLDVDSLKIVGYDVATLDSNYKYKGIHSPQEYNECIEWSVVSGNATISENGVLNAKKLGDTIVIRAQSTLDENLYAEKTIEVKLFQNAYYFVRKLLGHMGLSALLGFFIFLSLLVLSKRKWLCFTSPVFAFIYAGISEIIQYFTPGRFCLFSDVMIDFIGALTGIAVALILVVAVVLFRKIIKKQDNLNYLFRKIWIGNIFNKPEKILQSIS